MGTYRLAEAVLTNTYNLCFEQKYENYQNFSSESFHFSVVKFSTYLNRRVCSRDGCKSSPYKSYFRWGLEGARAWKGDELSTSR